MAVVRLDAPVPVEPALWVDAAPFRAHLQLLMAAGGMSSGEIALLAGLPARVVARLTTGRSVRGARRINPHVARRLLRLTVAEVRAIGFRAVPVTPTATRLRGMMASGWSASDLARRLGTTEGEVQTIVDERIHVCSQLVAVRAAAALGPGHGLDEGDGFGEGDVLGKRCLRSMTTAA